VDLETVPLPRPFMVLATQNPIEQEGTYPLPEAQMDRFLMHITIGYPDDEAEAQIVRLVRVESSQSGGEKPVAIAQEAVFAARAEIHQVALAEPMEHYLVSLIAATRRPAEFSKDLGEWILVGASPRGSIALDKVSRSHAWLHGRDHVTPDDIRAVVHDCLRHRLMLTYEANAAGVSADAVIDELIKQVAVA
jgi:MoxR-like ATPase